MNSMAWHYFHCFIIITFILISKFHFIYVCFLSFTSITFFLSVKIIIVVFSSSRLPRELLNKCHEVYIIALSDFKDSFIIINMHTSNHPEHNHARAFYIITIPEPPVSPFYLIHFPFINPFELLFNFLLIKKKI